MSPPPTADGLAALDAMDRDLAAALRNADESDRRWQDLFVRVPTVREGGREPLRPRPDCEGGRVTSPPSLTVGPRTTEVVPRTEAVSGWDARLTAAADLAAAAERDLVDWEAAGVRFRESLQRTVTLVGE